MTFETLTQDAKRFRPAFMLDRMLSLRARLAIRRTLYIIALVSLGLALQVVTRGTGSFLAVFFLALAFLAVSIAFELFYNSLRFAELPGGMTFELARIVVDTSANDITGGFVQSGFGMLLLKRLGAEDSALAAFLSERTKRLGAGDLSFDSETISLSSYATAVMEKDEEFQTHLFKLGILKSDFAGAVEWLERDLMEWKERRQWWTRRSLGKVPGLGKSLSYGQAWLLKKYGDEYALSHDLSGIDIAAAYHAAEVEELELVLSRSSEANAMIVAEDGAGAQDIVARLAKRLSMGAVHPALEHKLLFMIDPNALIAANGSKNTFEVALIKLMNEAIKAGNIMLVIPDFPGFIASAQALGSDAVSLLDPFLNASRIQFIALSDTMSYHQSIETNHTLAERFDKITVKGDGGHETISLLEDKVEAFEGGSGLFFTYQALDAIAESADRYIVTGVMPDKAVDLLVEIVPKMNSLGKKLVTKQDVLDMVEQKTGIPVAGVKDAERDKLTNLETILAERVVGQKAAIDTISNAMRRARSGVSNPDRPMGSFLFIGPTGVGKTETTKALAQVFFGDANRILRLDMSEYSAEDALNRLIGSFQTGKPGTLTTMLRENPYGVLLLDEFEKASTEVHNLFLQVLDEGVFSDMVGKKVNARNLIIIATSNAGSDLIWKLSQEGKDIAGAKDQVVDEIIKNGIFKPELMNRFDGVVLFHALGADDLRSIARIQLEHLEKRLEDRKLKLVVNDALVDFLVRQGSDPKFGARPLNRAIQDTIEGVIAKKLIAGVAKPGMQIELTAADLG